MSWHSLSAALKMFAMADRARHSGMSVCVYVCVVSLVCVHGYREKLSGLTRCTQSACDIAQG